MLDLDGTLLIGDGPALDHARELAALLDARTSDSGTQFLRRIEAYLAGEAGDEAIAAPDGYFAARALGLQAGLSDHDISTSFFVHRARMAGGEVPFHAPEGAKELIGELRSTVDVALVTNAPTDGLPAILQILGLHDAFDHVVGDAGKPAGLPGAVTELLAASGDPDFRRVLSVGDIWENDLAPLAAGGATTGHIDRHDTRVGTPTHRARTFDGLIPAIRAWASDPKSPVSAV